LNQASPLQYRALHRVVRLTKVLQTNGDIMVRSFRGGPFFIVKIPEAIKPTDIYRKIDVLQRTEAGEASAGQENIVPVKDRVLDQVQKSIFSDLKRVVTDLAHEMDRIRTMVQAIDELQPSSYSRDALETSDPLANSEASETLTPENEALLRAVFKVIPERSDMSQEHAVDNTTSPTGSGTIRQLYDAVVTKVKNYIGLPTDIPVESPGPAESTESMQAPASETIEIPVAVLSATPNTVVPSIPGKVLQADQSLSEPFESVNPRVFPLPVSEELINKDQTEKEIAKYGLRTTSQSLTTSPVAGGFRKDSGTATSQTYAGVGAGAQGSSVGINKAIMGLSEDPESSMGAQNPDVLVHLASDDRVVSRVIRFVDDVNTLLETAQNGGENSTTGTIQNQTADSLQIIRTSTRNGSEKQGMNGPLKIVFADGVSFEIGKSVGLIIKENGLLKLDLSSLVTSLSTHKDKTLTNIRDFANNLSDRIDFLANPFIGAYVYNKTILRTHDVTGDEKPSSLEQELTTEQNSLNERLKELKVLIDQSTVVRDWLARKKQDPVIDMEAVK
jgi:hypothetical protein